MQISDQIKKQVLTSILKVIARISDKEYQKRVWIRGIGPECDGFDETCCNLFNDFNINYLVENYKDFEISERQHYNLKNFRDEFRAFSDDNHWPHEFVDMPEWARIMDLAKDVLKVFDYENIIRK